MVSRRIICRGAGDGIGQFAAGVDGLSLIHIYYPGASYIANANTEELAETLCTASKGRYTRCV